MVGETDKVLYAENRKGGRAKRFCTDREQILREALQSPTLGSRGMTRRVVALNFIKWLMLPVCRSQPQRVDRKQTSNF